MLAEALMLESITCDKLAVFMLDSDLDSKSFSVFAIRSDRYLLSSTNFSSSIFKLKLSSIKDLSWLLHIVVADSDLL